MKEIVAVVFGLALMGNAALFVPQALAVWRKKSDEGISLPARPLADRRYGGEPDHVRRSDMPDAALPREAEEHRRSGILSRTPWRDQAAVYLRCAFSLSRTTFSSSSFCPASPSLPSAVKRW